MRAALLFGQSALFEVCPLEGLNLQAALLTFTLLNLSWEIGLNLTHCTPFCSAIMYFFLYNELFSADPSKCRLVCWDLKERGAVGETCLHLCLLNATSIHADLGKRLLRFYPKLINDIYMCDEYYGMFILTCVLPVALVNSTGLFIENEKDLTAECILAECLSVHSYEHAISTQIVTKYHRKFYLWIILCDSSETAMFCKLNSF